MFDPAIDRLVADRLADVVHAGGGVMFRVRLLAPPAVLLGRVGDRSRLVKDAIRDPTELERQLQDRDLFEPIAHDDLVLDTSTGDAGDLAERIWREVRPS